MYCNNDIKLIIISLLQEEQFRLKQELADLSIKLNMEAQKGRKQKFDTERYRKN